MRLRFSFILFVAIIISHKTSAQWVTMTEVDDRVESLTVVDTVIYATTGIGQVFTSADNGEAWTDISGTGLPQSDITSFAMYKGNLFAGSSVIGVFRSSDKGATWQPENNGIPNPHIFALAVDDSFIYAGAYDKGVYVSHDGLTWNPINNGMNDQRVYSLCIKDGIHIAGTRGKVFISDDKGKSWSGDSLADDGILGLAFDGVNIYAGAAGDGIFVSSDMGGTWDTINNGLDNDYVWEIVIYDQYIFAATSGGVFVSDNKGQNWRKINDGLPGGSFGNIIYSLTIIDDYLIAGNGWSILRRPISEVTDVNDPEEQVAASFMLEQNYPNPFNPITNILYRNSEGGFVSLKVYDILGKEIRSLVNEDQSAGEYSVTFEASGLASGIYYYTLSSGNHIETKKMVVLK